VERPSFKTEDFVHRAAGVLDVEMDTLIGRGKGKDTVRARELVATLGVERYRLKVKDLAAALCKSPEGVSRCLSRGIERRRVDSEFRNSLDSLDRDMADLTPEPE